MDENEAVAEQQLATPIFNVYRRGYDPEQVDRYVADQQRRLDDALRRASESERRLAAAVGQLRELHRRVAIYESETRTAQPPALDTLGERVQRILQEAWEGAYSLRQDAEREVNELREAVTQEVAELREVASREAADVVDQATRRALAIRDETERRRHAYLQRIEQDRERRCRRSPISTTSARMPLLSWLGCRLPSRRSSRRWLAALSDVPPQASQSRRRRQRLAMAVRRCRRRTTRACVPIVL